MRRRLSYILKHYSAIQTLYIAKQDIFRLLEIVIVDLQASGLVSIMHHQLTSEMLAGPVSTLLLKMFMSIRRASSISLNTS